MVSGKRVGRRLAVLAVSLVGAFALAAATSGSALAALYQQCPPVGNNLGCSQLITISKSGPVIVTTDPAAPPNGYDGSEDTLIGVQNNSGRAIGSLNLASTTAPIFAFDSDGLCNPPSWPNAPGRVSAGMPGFSGLRRDRL